MAGERGKKRAPILISSSSSSSGSEEAESSDTSESEYEFHSDSVDTLSSTSRETDSENDGSELNESDDERDESSESEEVKGEDSDHHLCRVMRLLRGKGDLQDLKLAECKAYLRKNGLRLSGTKEQCIERIMEHWRIKDGKGETFYPRSSFNINCTGDVCKGDVVLFTQKVYKNFDKMTRSGNVSGKRTIAGRIVKESYGAAKQQHTFTVEVLWSQGVKKLPPLFPLLVKGRNLYKLKTFRQRWKNEKERLGVLAEKHRRGAAARLVRETRKMRSMKRNQSFTDNKGAKKQKRDHTRPSGTVEKEHHNSKCGRNKKSEHFQRHPNRADSNHQVRGKPSQPFDFRRDTYRHESTFSFVPPQNYHHHHQSTSSFAPPQNYHHHHQSTFSCALPQNYRQFQPETYTQRMPYPILYDRAFISTMNLPHENSSSSVMTSINQRKYGLRHHPHP